MTSVTLGVEISTEQEFTSRADHDAWVEAARQHVEDELSSFRIDLQTEDFYGGEDEISTDCDGGTPWIDTEPGK